MVIDNDTKIIIGHGKLSNIEEYKNFLSKLETRRTNIQKAIDNS
ncbi:hypothetical protein [Winogradskyella sp. UBA3174]|nr:hypothetical protein [Winogradskyella sp. UBA3174]